MAKAATAPASFGSILDRAPSEIEKPKPLPQGSYVTVLVGQPRYDKSSQKQTEFAEYTHKFISAMDDVDEEALQAYLTNKDGTKKKLSDITLKSTYYLTEGATWRLKDFLRNCGLNLGNEQSGEGGDYDSLREAAEDVAGKQVGVFVNHEASKDGTSIFARINKTFAVE